MWQKMVRRLKASQIAEMMEDNGHTRCVGLAVHNYATLIIPLVDGIGTRASQTSVKIRWVAFSRQFKSMGKFPTSGEG